jgi:hypothetical protein
MDEDEDVSCAGRNTYGVDEVAVYVSRRDGPTLGRQQIAVFVKVHHSEA